MSLITELKRRNVFRVAVAYAVIAWVLAQVSDIAFDNFGTPDWVPKTVLFILVLGFPLAIFFAWAFELTPEGVKREKDVDRTQSVTNQTGRKLDYLIIAVLVVAVGFLLSDKLESDDVATTASEQTTVVSAADKSVAVLPFIAMSNGPDDEYFADGLTEEILNSLAQLPELLVTARTSAFAFKGQDIAITEIAAKLKVAHVVEGSVRRAGDQLRITAQLIRASDGFHLWSDTYDRSGEDSFGVQGEIAEKIAAALDVVMDDDELERMRSSGLRNPEAFIAYQKGQEISAEAHGLPGPEMPLRLLDANVYFDRTIELEPDFSAAYFEHADYYIHRVAAAQAREAEDEDIVTAFATAEVDLRNAARTATNKASRLNAELELALITRQWQRFRELQSAAYGSDECLAPSWWGGVSSSMEPSAESLAMWQRELACDPLNYYNWSNVGGTQLAMGDYQAAIKTATQAMESVPHRQSAVVLVSAHMAAGQIDEASAASQRYITLERVRDLHKVEFAAARGDAETANALLQDAIVKYEIGPRVAIWTILGDRERANAEAAKFDAAPLGFLYLQVEISRCLCGTAFDLEVTPNFARMVEEGSFPWPPPDVIDWPLKDW
jgi:adenylate cyclase